MQAGDQRTLALDHVVDLMQPAFDIADRVGQPGHRVAADRIEMLARPSDQRRQRLRLAAQSTIAQRQRLLRLVQRGAQPGAQVVFDLVHVAAERRKRVLAAAADARLGCRYERLQRVRAASQAVIDARHRLPRLVQQPVEAAVHIGLRAVEIAHQRGANAFAAAGDPGLGGVDQGCESGGLRFQVRSAAIHHLARAGRGSLDPVGGDVRHAGHLVGGGAGRFLQLAQLAGQALGRGQRAGAGFVRHFGQRMQPCFQCVDAFAQRMAIVHDLRGHARAAFFQRRNRRDQRVHARNQGGAGPFGSFGAVCRHLRAARDQFGGRFHIAAGRSAIAVEQCGLVLHRLPSGFELTRDPPEAQFEQIGLGAQRTRRFHIAARFSAAAAHQ